MLDALVILGCRMLPGGRPSDAARRRARVAARAFADGLAPRVVASGGRRWYGVSEAEILRAELGRLGVPESAVLLELQSLSTCENARGVRSVLEPLGAREVGVVTCDWHLPRALKSFRAAGLRPIGIAAPSPDRPGLLRAQRAARERVSFVIDRWATWGWSAP